MNLGVIAPVFFRRYRLATTERLVKTFSGGVPALNCMTAAQGTHAGDC